MKQVDLLGRFFVTYLEIGISPYYFVAEHGEWPINDVVQKIGRSIDEKLHTKNCFYVTRRSL